MEQIYRRGVGRDFPFKFNTPKGERITLYERVRERYSHKELDLKRESYSVMEGKRRKGKKRGRCPLTLKVMLKRGGYEEVNPFS